MRTDFTELVNAYLDESLAPEEREELERQLRADQGKAQTFRDLLSVHGLLVGKFAELEKPGEVMDKILNEQLQDSKRTVIAAIKQSKPRTPRRASPLPSQRSWAWPLAFVAALLLSLTVWFIYQDAEPHSLGLLLVVEGKQDFVTLQRGGSEHEAKIGQVLQPGDVLQVGQGVTSRVGLYAEGTHTLEATSIALAPNTRLALDRARRGGKFVNVENGSIDCRVAPQPKDRPLVFLTPDATATVLGTRFTLTVTQDATRLEVTEGAVKLGKKIGKDSVVVKMGHFAMARRHGPLKHARLHVRRMGAKPKVEKEETVADPRKRFVVQGFLSEEVNPRKIRKGPEERLQMRYYVTDRHGNKVNVPKPRGKKGVAGLDLDKYVGKVVSVRAWGTMRGLPGKKKNLKKIEIHRLLGIKVLKVPVEALEWTSPEPLPDADDAGSGMQQKE